MTFIRNCVVDRGAPLSALYLYARVSEALLAASAVDFMPELIRRQSAVNSWAVSVRLSADSFRKSLLAESVKTDDPRKPRGPVARGLMLDGPAKVTGGQVRNGQRG